MHADPIPFPKQSFLAFLRSFSFWGAPLLSTLFLFAFIWVVITADGDAWFEHPLAVPDNMWLYFGRMGLRLGFIIGLPMAIGTLAAYFARRRRFPSWNKREVLYAVIATSLVYLFYTGEVYRMVFSVPYQLIGFCMAAAWASERSKVQA